MKRFLLVFLILLNLLGCLWFATPINTSSNVDVFPSSSDNVNIVTEVGDTVIDKIGGVLFGNTSNAVGKVYLGGAPIGISLDSRGVKVIGISEILTAEGIKTPAIDSDIRIGDVILKLNDNDISSVAVLSKITAESNGESLSIIVLRKGEVLKKTILPQLDLTDNKYKLGLWAKEGSSGIGTLTYVKDNGDFGSLGHPIVNPENGEIYSIGGGTVYECDISGVVKGVRGRAGELRGSFKNKVIGEIYKNNEYGVYGKLEKEYFRDFIPIEVMSAKKVRPGKAQIYSTVNGADPEYYDIEIIKTVGQNKADDKGMVIRIVDEKLISITGGIVQGMSGSPILQDGKLVGAVTHVFINDPLKGYGIYAEWMLEQ